MRQKKASIYISTVLAFFALLLAVLLKYVFDAEFVSNVFLGIFGSAFATLVVFCYDYSSEKRKLIKAYCKKVDEIYSCREHIFMIEEIDGTIPSIYYDRTDNRSPIDRLCDLYLKMSAMRSQIIELFEQIDFFMDLPIKQWFQERNLILIEKDQKFASRAEKRLAKEEAKACYRDEHHPGKRKRMIEKRVQRPLMQYLYKVAKYANNEFSWYRDGLQEDEETVIQGLLELQKECFQETENGVSIKPAKWHEASGELLGTLVGSKVFWLKEN